MLTVAIALGVDGGGQSQLVVLAGAGAASSSGVIGVGQVAGQLPPAVPSLSVLIVPEVACYVRQGVTPVATNDGTDMYLPAGVIYRTSVAQGNKLSFNGATAGNVHVTIGG